MKTTSEEAQQVFRQFAWHLAGKLARGAAYQRSEAVSPRHRGEGSLRVAAQHYGS